MLKVLLIPGVLIASAVAFGGASHAGPNQVALTVSTSASDPGCSEASGSWMPGTLQIKDRSDSRTETNAELRIKRGQPTDDCALV